MSNLARKLEPITESKTQIKPKKTEKMQLSVMQKSRVRFLTVCNTCMFLVLITCAILIINSHTQLTVYTKDISQLNKEIEILKSQEISLNAQINRLFNLEYVEFYAQENLDMIKLDKNQIEQVYIQNSDAIKTYEEPNLLEKAFNVVKEIFSTIVEYIN